MWRVYLGTTHSKGSDRAKRKTPNTHVIGINQPHYLTLGDGTLGEHARREFALFDAAQVAAIVAYLWWKLDEASYDPTVEQALENYWLPREAEVSDAGRD